MKVLAHFVFFLVCEYSVLVLYINSFLGGVVFFSCENNSIKKNPKSEISASECQVLRYLWGKFCIVSMLMRVCVCVCVSVSI